MKNLLFLITLTTLFGCQPSALKIPKKLVIISPKEWRANHVDVYADYKSSTGLNVQVINVETIENTGDLGTWGYNLRSVLIKAEPDYVFLIGDASLIPTIYICEDTSSWTSFTNQACIYSDLPLQVADDQQTVLFSLGRLLAKDVSEVDNYLIKTLNYDSIYGYPSGAYLINDRDYDPTDLTVSNYANLLRASGVPTNVDTLNIADHPEVHNGFTEATYATLTNAVNNSASFIMYFGHGSSWGWGYEWNLLWPYLNFAIAKPVPLVYAMACETALGAPNTPWYPYYDSLGHYKNFFSWDSKIQGPITVEDMGIMSTLQFHYPYDVITDSIGRHFTSTTPTGAMVYIGETVVTHAEYNFNDEFLAQLMKAYKNGVETVGDIWYNTIKEMLRRPVSADVHPVFFQMIGDPSTSFPRAIQ